MFAVSPVTSINFADNYVNGVEAMVMQSSKNVEDVVSDFEKAFAAGMNPNALLDNILQNRNLTENDFTDDDIINVNRKVEAIYKTVDYQAWRQR